MKTQHISIVIPLHRMHLKNFDATFKSLKDAETRDVLFDVIVVLNGQHPNASKSYFLENPKKYGIKLVQYRNEKSCSIARNIGFKFTKSKIVAFLDGDITVPEDFFKKLKKYLDEIETNPSIAGLCPRFALNKLNETNLHKYDNLEDIRSLNSFREGKYINLFQGFCVIIKASVFKKLDMFDETFIASEDRELAIRVIKSGYKILYMPDVELLHFNPSSLINILKRKRWHAIGNAQLALKYPDQYKKTITERIVIFSKQPFLIAPFDVFAYLYYWTIMGSYIVYFAYFKNTFQKGGLKKDRY